MAVAPLPSREAEQRVIAAYDVALARIRSDAAELAEKQRRAQLAGDTISPSWLFRQQRYRRLEATVLREISHLEVVTERATRRAQAAVIPIGSRDALRSVLDRAPNSEARAVVQQQWGHFDPSSVERLVGNTANGMPLASLLSGTAVGARDAVTHALVTGIVAGQSPRRTARAVQAALGSTQARALTITRTETLRAYRAAAIGAMQQSDVVQTWTWVATLDATTCPMCWDANGSVHDVNESLDSHPNCRCAAIPNTVSWSAMGIAAPETAPTVEPGASVFARAGADVQRAVLGPGGYELYKHGVPLSAFSQRTHGPFGGGLRRVPNKHLQHLTQLPSAQTR